MLERSGKRKGDPSKVSLTGVFIYSDGKYLTACGIFI